MGRRARGSGGIHRRASDGLWIATVYLIGTGGKRHPVRRAAKTQAQAVIKLREIYEDIKSGKIKIDRDKTIETVADWLDKWITEIHKPSPSTKRDYRSVIRNYINPHVGKIKLDELTADHVRKMLRAQSSTRSAQKAHIVLRRAMDDAASEEHVNRNVVRIVPSPGHVKKRRSAYSEDTAKLILRTAIELDATRKRGPYLATRWMTAFMTGARQGECIGLEWDRLDLESGVVDISWQLKRHQYTHGCGDPDDAGKYPCGKVRFGFCPDRYWDFDPGYDYRECHRSLLWKRPKTNAGQRYVPLMPALWEALKVYRRDRAGDCNPHNLVWHHDDGRPVSQEEDNQAWNALIAACGITKTRGEVVLHEARNTAATQLLEAGVDVKVIQGILGHADILTTREYQRVSLEFSRSAVEGLARLVPALPLAEVEGATTP